MNEKTKWAVIGGQYNYICYGVRDSLHAAKMLATRSEEFHDNYAGFCVPEIWRIENTVMTEAGRVPLYGCPADYAKGDNGRWYPVAV